MNDHKHLPAAPLAHGLTLLVLPAGPTSLLSVVKPGAAVASVSAGIKAPNHSRPSF